MFLTVGVPAVVLVQQGLRLAPVRASSDVKSPFLFSSKLKLELPRDPAIPFLGMDPKELKTKWLNRSLHAHVRRGTSHNSQVETARVVHQLMNGFQNCGPFI